MSEEFLLKWEEHHNTFFSILQDLCNSDTLTDVTLACGGRVFEAHRLMLCVCSTFFRSILARPPGVRPDRAGHHPIVFLKDVSPHRLEQLLQYMYHGEINVLQEDLAPLIEAARCLQVKGLADAPTPPGSAGQQQARPPAPPKLRGPNNLSQPPPMKKARNSINHNRPPPAGRPPAPAGAPSAANALPANFALPTEPDPLESLKDEDGGWTIGNAGSDQEISQGGSDYDGQPEMMYEDDGSYGGAQVSDVLALSNVNVLPWSVLARVIVSFSLLRTSGPRSHTLPPTTPGGR